MKRILSVSITAIMACAFVASPLIAQAQTKKTTKKSTGKKVAAGTAAAAATTAVVAATDDQKAVAANVLTGNIPCEFGVTVTVTPNDKQPAGFIIGHKGKNYAVMPVESRTGAVRLENAKEGIVWMQLGNKSQMFNSKIGQRLADNCKHPTQAAFVMPDSSGPGLFDPAPSSTVTPKQ